MSSEKKIIDKAEENQNDTSSYWLMKAVTIGKTILDRYKQFSKKLVSLSQNNNVAHSLHKRQHFQQSNNSMRRNFEYDEEFLNIFPVKVNWILRILDRWTFSSDSEKPKDRGKHKALRQKLMSLLIDMSHLFPAVSGTIFLRPSYLNLCCASSNQLEVIFFLYLIRHLQLMN